MLYLHLRTAFCTQHILGISRFLQVYITLDDNIYSYTFTQKTIEKAIMLELKMIQVPISRDVSVRLYKI